MTSDIHRPTSRVLDILELLARTGTGQSLSEISRALNMPKSTLSPIMHTMEDRQFIVSDPVTGKYYVGMSAFFVGAGYHGDQPVLDYIHSRMQHITDACGETCHLGILSEGQVLYVAKIESPHPVSLRSLIGLLLPAYCTGLGKSLLSHYTPDQLHALYPNGLEQHTPNTITSFSKLEAELEATRRDGFSYEHGEYTDGIECVAVPLFVPSQDDPVAALSISVPAYRFNADIETEIKKLLLEERSNIEHHLLIGRISDKSQLLGQALFQSGLPDRKDPH